MDTIVKLMTNIGSKYYEFLESIVKKSHTTKRAILEEALDIYKQKVFSEKIKKSYQEMAKDKEYLKQSYLLAESGMDVYLKDINNKNGH